MITTILFDVGNVLLTFNPKEYYSDKIEKEKLDSLLEVFFSGNTWNQYDQGMYTEQELKMIFLNKAPELKEEINYFFDTYLNTLAPIEPNVKLALSLKKNYRISILSNMPEISEYYIIEKFPFLNEFELPLYSWKVRMIKPDSAIYNLQIERLKSKPEEILFIDDKQENLDTAAKLGMHTYLMKDTLNAPTEIISYIKTVNQKS